MTTGAFNDPSGDGNPLGQRLVVLDRKSTRLNSSHSQISYAVFCLKKKKKKIFQDSERNNLTNPSNRHYPCSPASTLPATYKPTLSRSAKASCSHRVLYTQLSVHV